MENELERMKEEIVRMNYEKLNREEMGRLTIENIRKMGMGRIILYIIIGVIVGWGLGDVLILFLLG